MTLTTLRTALLLLALGAATASAERLRVTVPGAALLTRPVAESHLLLKLEKGAELQVVGQHGGWYSVRVAASSVKGAIGVQGWISGSAVEAVAGSAEETRPAPPPPRSAPPAAAAPPSRPAPALAAPKVTTPTPPAPAPSAAPRPAPAASQAAPPKRPAPAQTPAPAPAAASQSGITVIANLTVAPLGLDFAETRTFTQFAEEGTLDVDYSMGTGFGGEVGLRYLVKKRMGGALSFTYKSGNGSAAFTGHFPHPLFLDRAREASDLVEDLSYSEAAVHLAFVYTGQAGSIDYAVFAGPTFFANVEADLIDVPLYQHAYPFDTVSITTVSSLSASGTGFGFNLGGDVSYRLSERLSAGLQLRYSRGSVDLDLDEANKVTLHAGGLDIGIGVRIRF